MQVPYFEFSAWLKMRLPYKVQKLPLNLGFTCPNRDGSIGVGGCIYCNNDAFVPSYAQQQTPVQKQIEEGMQFWKAKYTNMKYLAYLQAYSNTYSDLSTIKELYGQILSAKDVAGLVIGTRPDCISTPLLDYLEELSRKKFIMVEYGLESTNDTTLKLINRMHTYECGKKAVLQTKDRGIATGVHIIIGLPGENEDDIIVQSDEIATLHPDVLKLHQLQVVKGTVLEQMYKDNPFPLYTPEQYVSLVARYLEKLPADIAIDRFVSQTPPRLLVAPKWNLKPFEFNNMLVEYMKAHSIWQGKAFRF